MSWVSLKTLLYFIVPTMAHITILGQTGQSLHGVVRKILTGRALIEYHLLHVGLASLRLVKC